MDLINRPGRLQAIARNLQDTPVCALLGPRQCGKTTLARMYASQRPDTVTFDLENPVHRSRLDSAMLTLQDLEGLVIIDEIQRLPELFEVLRVLVDRPGSGARFLVLGSAAPRLVKGASESLAGRVGFVDLSGFDLSELAPDELDRRWLRGGLPRSFLARSDAASLGWRDDFIRTFLERDIPQLGVTVPAETLRRFWTMLAHFHGGIWNAAEFARSLGASQPAASRYLDLLSGAYMARQLQPWFANIKKRQVKAPKVYLRDSGLVHALLALETREQLHSHPGLGASWEGFVVEQIASLSGSRDIYYWRTHTGAELDLLLFRGGKATGYEIKYADAPRTTRSMRSAISDLDLHHLFVVYPGTETYPLDEKITCLAAPDLVGHFSS